MAIEAAPGAEAGPALMPASHRILIAHPSPDMYGADRVLLETVAGYVAAGWVVTVTLPAGGALVAEIEARGAAVELCPTLVLRKALLHPSGLSTLVSSTARALRPGLRLLGTQRPDVVLVNTVTLPLWLFLARLRQRKVMAHVHEAEDSVGRLLRLLLALPLLLAHSVIVNSDATASVVGTSLPLLRRKLRRIYNGVAGPESVSSVRSELDSPVRLVFVGRLSERKAADLAVAAVAVLKGRGVAAELEVVGSVFPGYEWYERQLRERIAAGGLQDQVNLSGFAAVVWQAYERADIALCPSRVESLGNSAIEAQLAGRPLVVSRIQGLVEVADGGRCAVIVDPDSPAGIADAVQVFLADWPAALRLAELARADAQLRFSPAAYGQAIVEAAGVLLPVPR